MLDCPPHRFVGSDSNNVQCVDCGFMRHRMPMDDETNINEIVDSLKRQSPYVIPESPPWQQDFYKWVNPGPNDYIVTIGTDTNSNGTAIANTYKIRPTDMTWTLTSGDTPSMSLTGTVV